MSPRSGRGIGSSLPVLLPVLVGWFFAASVHGSPDADPDSTPELKEKIFVTEHRGVFNGQRIEYRVRAGETFLRDLDGEPTGALFSFDYGSLDDDASRPGTFVWNGGPGSASLWLHMGTFGPKRVVVPDAGQPAADEEALDPLALDEELLRRIREA